MADASLKKIQGKNEKVYYYDNCPEGLYQICGGNRIYIQEDLEDVKEQNLVLYLEELFERFYEIQEKFNQDCKYDKEEDILWT